MSKRKAGCRYGLIVHGRSNPLCFSSKKERDRVANYIKGLITYSTFSENKNMKK